MGKGIKQTEIKHPISARAEKALRTEAGDLALEIIAERKRNRAALQPKLARVNQISRALGREG